MIIGTRYPNSCYTEKILLIIILRLFDSKPVLIMKKKRRWVVISAIETCDPHMRILNSLRYWAYWKRNC